jgi:hypothetical protein
MTTDHPPVEDWAVDFDHTDERYAANPFPIWDEIRSSACPIARTERYGGAWLPTRHADVSAIAYDTDHFSSRSILMSAVRPPLEAAPMGIAPPISSDPPFHGGARRVLLPAFSPQAVGKLEASTRAYCDELIDAMRGREVVDAATDYAQNIPVRVIATMLGFPLGDDDRFREFVVEVIEGVDLPPEARMDSMGALYEYLRAQIEDHTAHPRDDLTSFLLNAEIDGEQLGFEHVGRTIALLLLAGIDTTWSAIGASLFHLASTPGDRERLVAEPELVPTAVEELLRAYAPVTMARLVTEDIDFNGCPMKAEDWVLLPFPAANRDPEFLADADEVVIDREVNRHSAFGLGIHRCAGSHLARMELRVALEAWLDAFPTFTLADAHGVRWSGGQVRGPRRLPIAIG